MQLHCLLLYLYTQPMQGKTQLINANNQTRRLSLLQATRGHPLLLVHLCAIPGRLERVAGFGQRLQVCAVVFVGLSS